MTNTKLDITVRELTRDYINNDNEGVRAYNNQLDVRPPYQREYKYEGKAQEMVIDTILKGMPLQQMYWAKDEEGNLSVLDGQQRTISICDFTKSKFSITWNEDTHYFHSLPTDLQELINNYEIEINLVEGTQTELLKWFERINIAGVALKDQELKNAMYVGTWLHSAKQYFSKRDCPVHLDYKDYLKGSAIDQDYLEQAIKWINKGDITEYMAKHQHDKDAQPLYDYIERVFTWVKHIFPTYHKDMKGQDWGNLYNEYSHITTPFTDEQLNTLRVDEEVTKHRGIYPYLVTGDPKTLSLRAFSKRDITKYTAEHGTKCNICKEEEATQADHIEPWSRGGATIYDNLQMLCRKCNGTKSDN